MVYRITESPLDPNGLLVRVNGAPVYAIPVTIDDGNLAAGAVLGKITSGGKYILSLSGASDGSQTPVAVLSEPVDATGGDKTAWAYLAGEFDATKLTLGSAHTVASIREALAARGIFLHSPQPA